MCRVAVRNAVTRQQTRALENDSAALDASGIDIDALFASGVGNTATEVEADMDFLEYFKSQPDANEVVKQEEEMSAVACSNTAMQQPRVMGQPVAERMVNMAYGGIDMGNIAAGAMYGSSMGLPPSSMYAGQYYAGLQAPMGIPVHQQQDQEQGQQQGQVLAKVPNKGRSGKRTKTPEEIAEQEERVKRRRRESAQRSRQRKSAYMKNLECENHALKLENDRLRKALEKVTGAVKDSDSGDSASSLNVKTDDSSDKAQNNNGCMNHDFFDLGSSKYTYANNVAAEILGIPVE
jgi:regulator of replication initiation timing